MALRLPPPSRGPTHGGNNHSGFTNGGGFGMNIPNPSSLNSSVGTGSSKRRGGAQCDQCGQSFLTKAGLKSHNMNHCDGGKSVSASASPSPVPYVTPSAGFFPIQSLHDRQLSSHFAPTQTLAPLPTRGSINGPPSDYSSAMQHRMSPHTVGHLDGIPRVPSHSSVISQGPSTEGPSAYGIPRSSSSHSSLSDMNWQPPAQHQHQHQQQHQQYQQHQRRSPHPPAQLPLQPQQHHLPMRVPAFAPRREGVSTASHREYSSPADYTSPHPQYDSRSPSPDRSQTLRSNLNPSPSPGGVSLGNTTRDFSIQSPSLSMISVASTTSHPTHPSQMSPRQNQPHIKNRRPRSGSTDTGSSAGSTATLFFAGLARRDSVVGGYAWWLFDEDSKAIITEGNNAVTQTVPSPLRLEYEALLYGLKAAHTHGIRHVTIKSDSTVAIAQYSIDADTQSPYLQTVCRAVSDLHEGIQGLLNQFSSYQTELLAPEKNCYCLALADKAMQEFSRRRLQKHSVHEDEYGNVESDDISHHLQSPAQFDGHRSFHASSAQSTVVQTQYPGAGAYGRHTPGLAEEQQYQARLSPAAQFDTRSAHYESADRPYSLTAPSSTASAPRSQSHAQSPYAPQVSPSPGHYSPHHFASLQNPLPTGGDRAYFMDSGYGYAARTVTAAGEGLSLSINEGDTIGTNVDLLSPLHCDLLAQSPQTHSSLQAHLLANQNDSSFHSTSASFASSASAASGAGGPGAIDTSVILPVPEEGGDAEEDESYYILNQALERVDREYSHFF